MTKLIHVFNELTDPKYGLHWCLFIVAGLLYANIWANDITYLNNIYSDAISAAGRQGLSAIPEFFAEKESWSSFSPLTKTTYVLEHAIVNDYPPLSHVLNLILHALTVVVLFNLLTLALPNMPVSLRFLTCLIFTVHPVHTSVVDSLHGRSEMLGLLFGLLSFQAVFKWARTNKLSLLFQIVSFAFLALLAQPFVAVWFLFPVYVLIFIHRSNAKTILRVLGVFLFVLALYGSFRFGNIQTQPIILSVDNPLVLVSDTSTRLASAVNASFIYLKLLVYPIPLCSCYGFGSFPIVGWETPLVYITLAIYGFLIFVAALGSRKFPSAGLGAFILLFSILPATNIFQLQPEIANEKVLYGATIGFALLVAVVVGKVFSIKADASVVETYRSKPMLKWVLGLFILSSVYITLDRNFDWLNGYVLSRNDVRTDCGKAAKMKYLAGFNLRDEYVNYSVRNVDESIRQAESYLMQAIAQHDSWDKPYEVLGKLYLTDLSDNRAAVDICKRALNINANSVEVRMLLASALANLGNLNDAIEEYTLVLQIDNAHKEALNQIVTLYFIAGELESAKLVNRRFFQLHPKAAEPYIHEGNFALVSGDTTASLNYFQEALKINVDNLELAEFVKNLKTPLPSPSASISNQGFNQESEAIRE